jgi:outer membrane lipoprotein LolB
LTPLGRLARWWLALAAVVLLSACATPQRASVPEGVQAWSGRMALTVEGNQSQSFAGLFELRGNAQAGELTLSTPLGGTAALLTWGLGEATLRTGGQVRQFGSLGELVAAATGTALPVDALFDWLAGTPTPVPGWTVDVSQVGQGQLRALRSTPAPAAELRVAFEK